VSTKRTYTLPISV